MRVACKARLLAFCRASCVDMRYCAATNRLYTMHDCTFLMVTPAGQRNALQAVDVETKTVVATAHEFSEQYELICMAPLGGRGDWGNELVAGAVHGSASLSDCHPQHFRTSQYMFTINLFACTCYCLRAHHYVFIVCILPSHQGWLSMLTGSKVSRAAGTRNATYSS